MKILRVLLIIICFNSPVFSQNIEILKDSLANLSKSNDVLIFVNGFWGKQKYSPSHCNKEGYWQFDSIFLKPKEKWNYNQAQAALFFQEAYDFFGTHKLFFVDGGNFAPIANASKRQRRGFAFAQENFEAWKKKYQLTDSSKIHFVTHSMGGAYAEGMIKFLVEEKNIHVGKVLHISTSEAKDIKTVRNVFGPELRIQLISQGDLTVEKVNRIHGYRKDNISEMVADCDLFACFFENETSRPQAGDIQHALHLRRYTFEIINDLLRMDISLVSSHAVLQNLSHKVSYRKIKKNGCCVEFDVNKKGFFERE